MISGWVRGLSPSVAIPVTYTYDCENRLVSLETSTGTTTFTYDADGTRIKRHCESRQGRDEAISTTTYVSSLLLFLFNFLNFFSFLDSSYAAVPHLINYQGKLTDSAGKPVVDNTYTVTFKIYDNSAGNTPPGQKPKAYSFKKGYSALCLAE